MNISLSYRFFVSLEFFQKTLSSFIWHIATKFRLFNRPCLPSPRNLYSERFFSVSPAWAMKIKLWWLISTCISLSIGTACTHLNIKFEAQTSKEAHCLPAVQQKMLRLLDWIMSSDTVGASECVEKVWGLLECWTNFKKIRSIGLNKGNYKPLRSGT